MSVPDPVTTLRERLAELAELWDESALLPQDATRSATAAITAPIAEVRNRRFLLIGHKNGPK